MQSRPWSGYRLNPFVILVDPKQIRRCRKRQRRHDFAGTTSRLQTPTTEKADFSRRVRVTTFSLGEYISRAASGEHHRAYQRSSVPRWPVERNGDRAMNRPNYAVSIPAIERKAQTRLRRAEVSVTLTRVTSVAAGT